MLKNLFEYCCRKRLLFWGITLTALLFSTQSLFAQADPGFTPTQRARAKADSIAEHETFTVVETAAYFPGGSAKMREFLKENVNYPYLSYSLGEQDRVFIEFIVTAKGKITEIKILKGKYPSLNNEALRVISLMPDWMPATQDCRPVPQKNIIPISFKLPKGK
ncbi:MAG: energy transducer TonB [Bacteroidota bacterium]